MQPLCDGQPEAASPSCPGVLYELWRTPEVPLGMPSLCPRHLRGVVGLTEAIWERYIPDWVFEHSMIRTISKRFGGFFFTGRFLFGGSGLQEAAFARSAS